MLGEECSFNISGSCHQPKKNSFVCAACWNEASARKREEYKHLGDERWCVTFGCFNMMYGTDADMCTSCMKRADLPDPSRQRSRSPIGQRSLGKANIGGVCPKLQLQFKDMTTADILEVMGSCVAELTKRNVGAS